MTPVKPLPSPIDDITDQWHRELPGQDLGKMLLSVYVQRLGRLVEQDFERLCSSQYQMRSSEMHVLLALRRSGPPYTMRPTDLFRSLLVTSGAITKQVDRLEEKKLVRRLPDPSYRGGFLVQLTDRSRDLLDEVIAKLVAGEAAIPAIWAIPAEEREVVLRFCYRALALLEDTQPIDGRRTNGVRSKRRQPNDSTLKQA